MLSSVRLSPAGTGMARYRNLEPHAVNEEEYLNPPVEKKEMKKQQK